jgi:hypothetical protein
VLFETDKGLLGFTDKIAPGYLHFPEKVCLFAVIHYKKESYTEFNIIRRGEQFSKFDVAKKTNKQNNSVENQ